METADPSATVDVDALDTRTLFDKAESLAALTATLFLSLGFIGFWCMEAAYAARHSVNLYFGTMLAIAIVATLLDGYFAILVLSAFFSHTPTLPLAVALRQRLLPWSLRPLLALYWLVHFLAGVFMAFGMEWLVIADRDGRRSGTGETIFTIVLAYVFAYAANAYLLASVAALTRNQRLLSIVWRLRLLTDLAIAVGVPLIFRHFHRA